MVRDENGIPDAWGGEYDVTTLDIAEPFGGVQTGIGGLMVHPKKVCEGRGIPCCIHSPSEHHMRTWQMNWRGDTGVMERFCPHGIGHPDPDHIAYVNSLTPEHECREYRGKRYAGKYNSPNYWPSHFSPCKYPHLDWQVVHGCDGCCTPVQHEQQST